jgi:tol-pal system protein YbgF
LTFNECIDKLAQAVSKSTIHSLLFGGFMGLKNLIGCSYFLRHSWFVLLVLVAFLLVGCGESEEMTKEEPQAKAATPGATSTQEQPKEENPSDQALTSFIGADTEQPAAPAPAPAVTPTQLSQYEKQIEDLRTENTRLKQNIVKLEQENRTINARMSEIDAKYTAEKYRADSTELVMKSSDLASKGIERQKATLDEERSLPASQSTYDNAMKAFKARKYDNALKGFKAIVDGGSEDELANRAKYWLGETYFAKKNYKEAIPLFQEVLKVKNSEKKADAQFMMARAYENIGSKAKAKAAYEKVVKNYPMSKNVKVAKARWAKL